MPRVLFMLPQNGNALQIELAGAFDPSGDACAMPPGSACQLGLCGWDHGMFVEMCVLAGFEFANLGIPSAD